MAEQVQNGVQFSSLFGPTHVICQTEETDRDKVVHALLRQLAYERGIGNVEHAYDEVLKRENKAASILGPGIAVPHVRLDSVDSIVVGIATSVAGIKYGPSVAEPIKLIILILVPKTAPGAYLQVLSSLAKICQEPGTAENIAKRTSAEEVWRFFDRGGVTLPEHILARDVMDPVEIVLQEDDTLERAIDLFIRHRRCDLPVVDKEGELVGVVTTFELLRVCLPDYILWMEDLSPILNFEPFAEILRKESQTWLTEIMTDEYATVAEDAPAIQVAKEITRQRVGRAYVVRGRELVGVVSLEGFLYKILRE